ncbi:LysR family transcriptional regulator [Ruegeria lacuscaerulensis]|uniref:LysR family transcriptional regulator n=1 Tax=Ruegeria lacuscaerulensis TaxID=55218 RepID=UPI001481C52A|nr:LysR family transcriptional regulator [Ruegeria lacuscaerulensis]
MFDYLRGMAIFSVVAEAGSFSAAGKRLGLATSGVSQHVSNLEKRLGTTLFYRSTRALSLTADGKSLLEASQRMLSAAEDGVNRIVDSGPSIVGELTITMPTFMNNTEYEHAIWDFARENPGVSLTVMYSEHLVDLVKEGVDLALRLGELSSSNLRSRRIGTFSRTLVGAPRYLDQVGPVLEVDDLARCEFLSFQGLQAKLVLTRWDEEIFFMPSGSRIRVDSFFAIRSALLAGLGIHRGPSFLYADDIAEGRLQEVLPDWKLPNMGIFAVWPDIGGHKAITRMLVEHIVDKHKSIQAERRIAL